MKIPNIVIVPAQFGRMLPRLIGVADVLLLPNVPVHKESEFHTSPIKSFSYMASGKPIIASDMPSIREVLNEQNAVLVMPGAADAFKKAIDDVRKGGLLVEGRAKQALATVNEFTWHRRVAIILREITQRTQLK